MKTSLFIIFIILATVMSHAAKSSQKNCVLNYKFIPGSKLHFKYTREIESNNKDDKAKGSATYIYEYMCKKGSEKGWVSITANRRSIALNNENIKGFCDADFITEMNMKGETRKTHLKEREDSTITDSLFEIDESDLSDNKQAKVISSMSKQILSTFKKQYAIAKKQNKPNIEAEKSGFIWFPVLPKHQLKIGDSFDVKKKMSMGGRNVNSKAETTTQQKYTLNKISDGKAYFSLKQREISKMWLTGDPLITTSTGRGHAVFDLKRGMWISMYEKSSYVSKKQKVENELFVTQKYTMEEK